MFKRFSALVTALFVFLSVFSVGSINAFANGYTIHINEVFDDYPTNSEDSLVSADSGIDTRVAESDGNKYYYARAWSEDVELKLPVNIASKDFIISGKVRLGGTKTNGNIFTIVDSSNRECPILTFGDNGSVTVADGKRVNAKLYDNWITLECRVNMSTKKITLYIDDKLCVENWTLKPMNVTYFKSLKFVLASAADGTESNIALDDIRVYEANDFLEANEFPAKKYNAEVIEYKETLSKPELGNYVFFDIDFTGGTGALTPINKTKVTSAKDENGNGYALFSRIGDVYNAYADMYLSAEQQKVIAKSKGLVIEADVMPIQTGADFSVLSQRDANGGWSSGINIKAGGEWSCGNASVALPAKEWTRLGIVYNYIDNTLSYYMNGELKETTELTKKRPKRQSLRVDIPGNGTDVEYGLDNIKMYEGISLKERVEAGDDAEQLSPSAAAVANFSSAMETEADAKKLIGNSVVLMLTSGMIYANGEKVECSVKPFVSAEGRTMIPVRLVAEKLGCTVDWNESERKVTINGTATMTIDKHIITVNGEEFELDSPPVIVDGSTFLPLRALGEQVLGKKVSWDSRGMAILSDDEYPYTDSAKVAVVTDPIDTVFRYMQYDRPRGEEIEALIAQKYPNNEHPRLIIDKDGITAFRKKVENDEYSAAWARRIIDQAEVDYNQPVATYYKRDGLRLLPVSWVTQEKIERWTTAYWLTGDTRYPERAWLEIEATSKFPDWNDKAHFLDTAEMANAYALAYDAFYDVYTDEQKKLMRDTVFEKAFIPGLEAYSGNHPNGYWITGDDNWTAVCPAGLLVAALVMIDDGDYAEVCRTIISQTSQSLEYIMGLFYPDGAWYESFSYLSYTMHHLAMGIGGLINCTGDDFNYLSAKGFGEVGNFFLHMHGPAVGGFNYHDGATGFEIEETFLWYSRAMNNPGFMGGRMSLGRFLGDATDPLYPYGLVWYLPEWDTGDIVPPLDAYYEGAGTGTMRREWYDKSGEFVGVHAGRNHIDHDNLDLGSFIFESDSVRWALDLGSDSYNLPGYFSLQGYNYYRKRPEGNNCLVINPREGHYGQYLDAYCTISKSESEDKGAYMVFDLTDAYRDDAHSALRGFYFGDDRRTLLIRDELDLIAPSEMYWFMHTKASITTDGKSAILEQDGKKLRVEVYCDGSEWEILEMPAEPFTTSPDYEGQADNTSKGYRKLAVKFKGEGKVNLSVKLIPVKDGVTAQAPDNTMISDWNIPD